MQFFSLHVSKWMLWVFVLVFGLASVAGYRAFAEAPDATKDSDSDGLPDQQEFSLGTNIYKTDTDNDGLSDSAEVNMYHTNPAKGDTDGDGYADGLEISQGYSATDASSGTAAAATTTAKATELTNSDLTTGLTTTDGGTVSSSDDLVSMLTGGISKDLSSLQTKNPAEVDFSGLVGVLDMQDSVFTKRSIDPKDYEAVVNVVPDSQDAMQNYVAQMSTMLAKNFPFSDPKFASNLQTGFSMENTGVIAQGADKAQEVFAEAEGLQVPESFKTVHAKALGLFAEGVLISQDLGDMSQPENSLKSLIRMQEMFRVGNALITESSDLLKKNNIDPKLLP